MTALRPRGSRASGLRGVSEQLRGRGLARLLRDLDAMDAGDARDGDVMDMDGLDKVTQQRAALAIKHAVTCGEALTTAKTRGCVDPVVILARPQGDSLARSVADKMGATRVRGEDVVVAVVERATALRHLGPAVAAEVEAGLRNEAGPLLLCIAWGGATVGPVERVNPPAQA